MLLTLLWLLFSQWNVSCDPPVTILRAELEDLKIMKSRLLVDFPLSAYGSCRLMYVENRTGSDPLLQPEQWALGIAGPLITAGPVSLRGILAQLYNPLAHGPGSDVFADPPDLCLSIDLEVAGRRGLELGVIPGHWNLFGLHGQTEGVQLGSSVIVPIGGRFEGVFTGLLSSAPGLSAADSEESWYTEDPAFPGGLVSHLAGSLRWRLDSLSLSLAAAASAGQWLGPGTFATLHVSRQAPPFDLDLLLGYCSAGYFTPEGKSGNLEWLIAARAMGDAGPLHLAAGWAKEIDRLPVLPAAFRESCDRLTGGIEIRKPVGWGCTFSIRGDASLELQWSTSGTGGKELSLEGGTSLDWRIWRLELGAEESRDSEGGRSGCAGLSIVHNPPWGEASLEAGYRHGRKAGFYVDATVEAVGEGKRVYIRLETRDVLSPPDSENRRQAADWLQRFSLRFGWEAKSRRDHRRS